MEVILPSATTKRAYALLISYFDTLRMQGSQTVIPNTTDLRVAPKFLEDGGFAMELLYTDPTTGRESCVLSLCTWDRGDTDKHPDGCWQVSVHEALKDHTERGNGWLWIPPKLGSASRYSLQRLFHTR